MNSKIISPEDSFLLDCGKVFVWGDIDEDLALKFSRHIRYVAGKGLKTIYVYIHSDGGDVDAVCSMIDEIEGVKSQGIEVNTIANGKAFSAAAYLLTFGTNRYATNNATIMLHPILFDLDLDYIDAQRSYTDFTNLKYQDLISKVAKNCGRKSKNTVEKFMSEIKDGLWLMPKQAIKMKVIDSIWDYGWENEINEQCNKRRV